MVIMLEEKLYEYESFEEAYWQRKAELLSFLLTLLAQGLQNGLACNQVVNKMSLEQVYIPYFSIHNAHPKLFDISFDV
jgi:hypothetical protein